MPQGWIEASVKLSPNPATQDRTLVGCAFRSRLRSLSAHGLAAWLVVPSGLSPKAALRRHILWLVKRACLSILRENPTTGQWGKGSNLVYRASLEQLKPVFVVCSKTPKNSEHCRVARSCMYGAGGFWVVPHPLLSEGGTWDDEF